MAKAKFSNEFIHDVLARARRGANITQLCRDGGFSDTSFYNWRRSFESVETVTLPAPAVQLDALITRVEGDLRELKSRLRWQGSVPI